jgi:hypothetical protein
MEEGLADWHFQNYGYTNTRNEATMTRLKCQEARRSKLMGSHVCVDITIINTV